MTILTSHMMVTKNPPNVHIKCFWTVLVTFIFNIKIDVNMYEPHYVNLAVSLNLPQVHVFDFLTCWHLFDILTSFWYFDLFLTFWHLFDILTSFLGGLSLHLNLILWRLGISFQQFGTLPIGLFLSNLDSRQLMTSPRTLFGQFWHMSIFGNSRAVRVICQKKMPSVNRFFFSMKERQGFKVSRGFRWADT